MHTSEGSRLNHNCCSFGEDDGVGGGLDVILAISCSASVHVNILHSAVIAGSRG